MTSRIGPQYSSTHSKPGDELWRQQEAARRRALEEHAGQATQPNQAMSEYLEAEAAVLEELGAKDVTPSGPSVVDQSIAAAVNAAGERVQKAALTAEERLAKAIASELKGSVIETPGADIYVEGSATEEETAQLVEDLGLDNDDEVVGTDDAGNTVYRDSATSEDYILTEE